MSKSKNEQKSKLKKIAIWTTIVLVLVLGIFTTIENATSGAEISKLESEEETLLETSRNLSRELVSASSLTSLSQDAVSLGFVKPGIFYIGDAKEEVAKLP